MVSLLTSCRAALLLRDQRPESAQASVRAHLGLQPAGRLEPEAEVPRCLGSYQSCSGLKRLGSTCPAEGPASTRLTSGHKNL